MRTRPVDLSELPSRNRSSGADMNWFWHPLISPAVGAYCLIGVVVFGALWRLFERARQPNADQ